MVTNDDLVIAISQDLYRRMRRSRKFSQQIGMCALREFPDKLFKSLSSPPESGRIRFGDYALDSEDTTKLLRSFHDYTRMICYLGQDPFHPSIYTVFATFERGEEVCPYSKTFFFRADYAYPVHPPSV
jgi:hypothetical protein